MRTVKFDAIRIAEMSANFMTSLPSLTTKAAFVNNSNGATHGWITGGNWSPETFTRLALLRESMEQDLEAIHFEDAAVPSTATSAPFTGLGEYLKSVPQS